MALSATELRIGNLVWTDYSGEMIVCAILGSSAVDLQKTIELPSGQYLCKDIDPIPLTEERLLRFGFEEHKIHGYYFKDCGEYEIRIVINAFSGSLDSESSWFVSIQTGYYSQPVTLVRKYVHEIQNLFFVLNEEELSYENK